LKRLRSPTRLFETAQIPASSRDLLFFVAAVPNIAVMHAKFSTIAGLNIIQTAILARFRLPTR
jgi:hypothetical protein